MIPTQTPLTSRTTTPTPEQQMPSMDGSGQRIRPSHVPWDDNVIVNSPPRFLVRHARSGRSPHRRFRPQPRRARARQQEDDRSSRSSSRQHHGRSRSPLQFRPRGRRSSVESEDEERWRRPRPGPARFARPWHTSTPGTPSPHADPALSRPDRRHPRQRQEPVHPNHHQEHGGDDQQQLQAQRKLSLPNLFALGLTRGDNTNRDGDGATPANTDAPPPTTSRPLPRRPTGVTAVPRVLGDPACAAAPEAKVRWPAVEVDGVASLRTARKRASVPFKLAPHGREGITAPAAFHPAHSEQMEGERLHALVSKNLSLLTLQGSTLAEEPVAGEQDDGADTAKLKAQVADAAYDGWGVAYNVVSTSTTTTSTTTTTATSMKPVPNPTASPAAKDPSDGATGVESRQGNVMVCFTPFLDMCGRLPSHKQQQQQPLPDQQQQQSPSRNPLQFRPLSRSDSSSASLGTSQ